MNTTMPGLCVAPQGPTAAGPASARLIAEADTRAGTSARIPLREDCNAATLSGVPGGPRKIGFWQSGGIWGWDKDTLDPCAVDSYGLASPRFLRGRVAQR